MLQPGFQYRLGFVQTVEPHVSGGRQKISARIVGIDSKRILRVGKTFFELTEDQNVLYGKIAVGVTSRG